MHIIVAPMNIQLSEILCTLEVVNKFRDKGEGIAIFHYEDLVDLHQVPSFVLIKKTGEAIGDLEGCI